MIWFRFIEKGRSDWEVVRVGNQVVTGMEQFEEGEGEPSRGESMEGEGQRMYNHTMTVEKGTRDGDQSLMGVWRAHVGRREEGEHVEGWWRELLVEMRKCCMLEQKKRGRRRRCGRKN